MSIEVEGRNKKCDTEMQKLMDELKAKRQELLELKNKVLECHCKVPVDVSIQAQRTPSIAALCHCLPDDKLDPACVSFGFILHIT